MKKQAAFLSTRRAPGGGMWGVLAPHRNCEEPAQPSSWVLVLGTAAGVCWGPCLTQPCLLL